MNEQNIFLGPGSIPTASVDDSLYFRPREETLPETKIDLFTGIFRTNSMGKFKVKMVDQSVQDIIDIISMLRKV